MGISISLGISPRESFQDWIRFAQELDRREVGRLWLIDSQLAMKDVYTGWPRLPCIPAGCSSGPG
jgi:hypothetical protein